MQAGALFLAAMVMASGCEISTRYTPRTRGRAVLGIQRGEPVIYKGGVATPLGRDAPWVFQCSQPAYAASVRAAAHQDRSRSSMVVATAMNWIAIIVFPILAVGAVFTARGVAESRHAQADLIDAINQHNDETACGSVR